MAEFVLFPATAHGSDGKAKAFRVMCSGTHYSGPMGGFDTIEEAQKAAKMYQDQLRKNLFTFIVEGAG